VSVVSDGVQGVVHGVSGVLTGVPVVLDCAPCRSVEYEKACSITCCCVSFIGAWST